MLLSMLRISRYRARREFGRALGVGVEPEEMRLPKSPMREGTVVGAEEPWEFSIPVPLLQASA